MSARITSVGVLECRQKLRFFRQPVVPVSTLTQMYKDCPPYATGTSASLPPPAPPPLLLLHHTPEGLGTPASLAPRPPPAPLMALHPRRPRHRHLLPQRLLHWSTDTVAYPIAAATSSPPQRLPDAGASSLGASL
jgi:hypothetical protein